MGILECKNNKNHDFDFDQYKFKHSIIDAHYNQINILEDLKARNDVIFKEFLFTDYHEYK